MDTEYSIRRLELQDVNESYFQLLSALREHTPPSMSEAQDLFDFMRNRPETYGIFVAVHNPTKKVVGTGTLLIERKYLRGVSKVGHIEDVIVHPEHRGKHLGMALVSKLAEEAKAQGCYKSILASAEDKQRFYEKCGFKRKDSEMALYYQD